MDGNYLLSVEQMAIRVYAAETGLQIAHRPCAQQIHCLAVADDGRRILLGNADGSVMLINLDDILGDQRSPPCKIYRVFSPNAA